MIKIIYFNVLSILLYFVYYGLKKHNSRIKILSYLGILSSIIYITWRLFFTIPTDNIMSLIFGILLISFEIVSILQSFIFKFLFSKKHSKIKLNKDENFTDKLPTVDIFISTYNESYEILERTIVSAKAIDYPKDKFNVYIGDDGKREKIQKLANKYKVNYCTREDNSFAKAGNINNMFSKSNGEFILLLDADMIPRKNILEEMIYYFEDSKMGFVQAPQVFYNLDPFQYNLNFNNSIPNEQDFFMRTIQEKRAYYNAVLHVGTNAVFRRDAIRDIGGIPTGSITEDMATGLLIQNEGYKSYFVSETLAIGLAVESFEDYIVQRDRWCRGNLQVFRKYNPFKMKNINFIQKAIYSDGLLYWMFGLQKMTYIISPLLYLLFGIKILNTNGYDLILFFVPYYIGSNLFFKALSDNTRNMVWSHIYDTAIAPQIAMSYIKETFFSKFMKLKFNVTPKGLVNNVQKFKWELAIYNIILIIISSIAFIKGISIILKFNFRTEIYSATAINLFWLLLMLLQYLYLYLLLLKKQDIEKQKEQVWN